MQFNAFAFKNNSLLNKKIVVFSGGTGSYSLIKGLLKKGADVTILINAYDDGKSTGDIRKKFNILGPSDIAKNIITLLDDSKTDLKNLLEYRLPLSESSEKLKNFFSEQSSMLKDLLDKIEPNLRLMLELFLNKFYEELKRLELEKNEVFELKDYAVRNIIYVGAYFYYNKDNQYTINKLIELFDLQGNIVLNSQEHLFLIGITENGVLLNSEASIVKDNLSEEIAEIFLVKQPLNSYEMKQFYSFENLVDKINYLKNNFSIYPEATTASLNAIKQSDLIIFAPTTFYSSLIPTIITKGISKAINKSSALKISVANLIRERGHHTLGENLEELNRHLNYWLDEYLKTELDYLLVNTHGYRTDGVINASRIPIDRENIVQQGIELIEVDAEDSAFHGKHHQDKILQVICHLKHIDELNYKIYNNKLVKKEEMDVIKKKKEQLKSLLNNPFLYSLKQNRIKELVTELLNIKRIDDFKPVRPVKVVILGAGKGNRLNSDIPKIIYPICGTANLHYLLERYSLIDNNPIVVINERDKSKIDDWLKKNLKYSAKIYVSKDNRGTAMTFLDVLRNELKDFDGDVFLSWGDITNIRLETIKLTVALHQAIETTVMTLPTCWEKNPYAGLIRNNEGNICDVFLTKEHPEQTREFGEHDSSVFVLKSKELIEVIKKIVDDSGIENGKINELNLLKIIPILANNNKEILGINCADPRECMGFNTQEEAKLVEQYQKELEENKLSKSNVFDVDIETTPISEKNTLFFNEHTEKEHINRFKKNIGQTYAGLLIDVDDTLTDDTGNIPDDILKKLADLSNKGIPIGISTGRTNNSLTDKLISKLPHNSMLPKIYIYPENGAYCYRLDQGVNKKLYHNKTPFYFLETAITFIRKKILELGDNYSVTKNKIHIWPKNQKNQEIYVSKINSLFNSLNLPLVAYKSNSIKTSGSILISGSEINKGIALSHFSEINNIPIDKIVKIGDMADINSVDHSLLIGAGSFSVNEFHFESEHQVGLVSCGGNKYEGANGTRFLLNELKFSTRP
ncbi:hypothetical protein COV11_01130 [Candidatus Woesearchaeota archaeon CG10_big_fil_rev_8_21_14_0_10_30_7]|nr:MAG: hypothetical protein COV11_01130 [Candidatus Woesearchaeota archaeon CG10_big_fil_rev_8_21_14_0_10_30_7]